MSNIPNTVRVETEISLVWAAQNPDLFLDAVAKFRDDYEGWGLKIDTSRAGFITLAASRDPDYSEPEDHEAPMQMESVPAILTIRDRREEPFILSEGVGQGEIDGKEFHVVRPVGTLNLQVRGPKRFVTINIADVLEQAAHLATE